MPSESCEEKKTSSTCVCWDFPVQSVKHDIALWLVPGISGGYDDTFTWPKGAGEQCSHQ